MFSATASQVTNGTQYVDDVFSAYTYTGNGSTQTITNGIDLAGKGGLVWTKSRVGAYDHTLFSSAIGDRQYLFSNSTAAMGYSANGPQFQSTGFYMAGGGASFNANGEPYASWTFRKAPKFFDVVTFVAGASTNRRVSHSLGQAPGCVYLKRIDGGVEDWFVYHISLGQGSFLRLNTTAASVSGGPFWGTSPHTTTDFGVTETQLCTSGGAYVAYLFAHDTSTDGIIQCGTWTDDGSGVPLSVNLGWEPQYLLSKRIDGGAINWIVRDTSRDWTTNGANDAGIYPNISAAESLTPGYALTSTGFKVPTGAASQKFIYLAIRRPNKPPTSGTQVYNAIARTGTGAAATVTGVGFAPDLVNFGGRDTTYGNNFHDRLRGGDQSLGTSETRAEISNTYGGVSFDVADGYKTTNNNLRVNGTGYSYINHFFRRAVGVFDQVCYKRPASEVTLSHNLVAIPELIIAKDRTTATAWMVYTGDRDKYLRMDSTNAIVTSSGFWGTSGPTAATFQMIPQFGNLNDDCTAYLFATLPGISKVGSYTGNGSSQTINCGFSTGARFILIKRTDSTGDWYVWDTVRGIIAGNDPHLSLNTTAAEVTTDDSIDPDTSGFIVNQLAATNINVTSASYIFLAFA